MQKLIFVILLVAGGYFAHKEGWLDGTFLSIHPSLELDLGGLSGKTGENHVLDTYPKLDWDCFNQKTSMGDRVCAARIRSWNDVMAKYTAFFFNKNDKLNMVKFAFPEKKRTELINMLNTQYGSSRKLPDKNDPNGESVLMWVSGNGYVAATENDMEMGEASIAWMSSRYMLEQKRMGRR